MPIKKVKKRDNRIVDFDIKRIKRAIEKAFDSVNMPKHPVDTLCKYVVEELEHSFNKKIPSVEDISDIIEKVLMEHNYHEVAKSFIIYREYRRKIRELRKALGSNEESSLSMNALRVLRGRILIKDANGNPIETPDMMFKRVANNIAMAEANYVKDGSKKRAVIKEYSNKFYNLMRSLKFLPNSPTLMNAGTELQQLSACFVLPVEDSLEGIFETLKHAALIHKSGGGTGFAFSRLRPKGDFVKSTCGVASGPVSFMTVYNAATEVIKQGGKRRGANMGILRVDHPDILEFITCKQQEGRVANFNISVGITDDFMEAVKNNTDYDLVNPRTGEVVKRISARSVFDLILSMSWNNGEPGVVFLDEINRKNQVKHIGFIEATNPCGEQPLLPYESCNLGSINLAKFVKDGKILWNDLRDAVHLSVRFLDNVIDMNNYPIKEIEIMTKKTRKIGLGVMGWGDMLYMLRIPYDSDKALYLAEKVMKFIEEEGITYSSYLAQERGNFPAFKGSYWDKEGYKHMRNSTITTVAPTGTLSMIADVASGIEPFFSLVYTKTVLEGQDFLYTNPYLEKELKERNLFSEELLLKIKEKGSIQDIDEIPEDMKKIYVVALDIDPEWHIKMQAAFQKYVHSAVSKTINLPNHATTQDIERAIMLAYKLKCKGLTIYRDGSRIMQVLTKGEKKQKTLIESKDLCPVCNSKMAAKEGCHTCISCGYSKCKV